MSSEIDLPRLMEMYPEVRGVVENLNISQKAAVVAINQFLEENGEGYSTTRFSVRRARARLSGLGPMIDPLPRGMDRPQSGSVKRASSVPTWAPGIEYDAKSTKGPASGELRTTPRVISSNSADVPPDEAQILSEFDLDPEAWEVTQLRRSRWQSPSGEWLEAYRASFTKRGHARATLTDEEISHLLSQYQQDVTLPTDSSDKVIMAPIGDTQLGKPDGGGTEETIRRFHGVTEQLRQRLEDAGGVSLLILPWLGDCLEGYVSQGGKNVARLDISITEQVRVYRRLMWHQIATLAPYAEEVVIPVVGGNHDETYREQTLSPNDSWAIEGASAIADMISEIDAYSHVRFIFPDDEELGVTVNFGTEDNPYVVHFEHGHMARSPEKMVDWWKGQSHGRQKAGEADMLVTAHWHHLRVLHTGGRRIWLQLPAMDGGSDWFRRKTGDDSVSGMLSMELVGGQAGFKNLQIHTV